MQMQGWNPNEVEDALAGWDPRKEHYMSYQSSAVESEGPLANFSRSANLARTKENVSEPYGLYVKNVPLHMKPENLQHLFSEYGKVLSVYVRKHKPEQSNFRTTWAIIKVESMREVIAMIGGLNDKPPLNLKVELSLTEEERARRRREKDLEQQYQQEMEEVTASRIGASSVPVQGGIGAKKQTPWEVQTKGAGRGRVLSSMYESSNPGIGERVNKSSPYSKGLSDQRYESPASRSSEVSKPVDDAVVEIGCGSVAVGYRRPRPCVACGVLGQLRCSVCKAWYCGKLCQVDDWFYHREKCSPPPPLEDADSYSNYLLLDSQKKHISEVSQSMQSKGNIGNEHRLLAPDIQNPSFSNNEDDDPVPSETIRSISQEAVGTSFNQNGQDAKISAGWKEQDYSTNTKDTRLNHVSEKGMSSRKINGHSQKIPTGKLRRPYHAIDDFGNGEPSVSPVKDAREGSQNSSADQLLNGSRSEEVITPDTKSLSANKVEKSNVTETQETTLSRLSNGPPATLSNGSLPPEQRTLAEKVQVGCEYQGAIISNKGDYRTFTLTLMVESSDSVLDQVLEVLPSIPMDPDFKAVRGSLVAALSKQDGSWYRAYVHDIEEGEYSVCHIDFGDVEKVEKVKALPPGPLKDFPGHSMIGKLHALVRPEYQKELEALIVPDKQITIQVMGKKTSSLKVGVKSENSGEILAYYILRSWYTGLPNLAHQITPTGSFYDVEVNNNSKSSPIKGSAPHETHVATTKQTSERAADVCQFIPHSVLVSGVVKEKGNDLLNTGSRVGGTHKKLEIDNKTDKPLEHSSPKSMGDMQETSQPDRTIGDGESKQGSGGLSTPKGKLSGITNKFWARDLPSISAEPGKEYTVLPIWLTEDNMLYVQIVSESTVDAFGKLLYDMNTHCEKGKVPDSITVGEIVCGYVMSEEMWYRCEVLAVNDQQITVHLCDFGNQEQIHKESIRTFTSNFMRDQRFCMKVKLAGVSKYDSVARTKLQALIDGQKQLLLYSRGMEPLEFELFDASGRNVLTEEELNKEDRADATVVSESTSAANVSLSSGKPSPLGNSERNGQAEKHVKVRLTSKMQLDIAEQPASAKTSSNGYKSDDAYFSAPKVTSDSASNKIRMYEECKSTSLPISDKVTIIVLEASSPHAISVVPYESLDLYDKLEELSVTMNQYCNSRVGLYRPRVGEMCLAKFSEDDQWYRGVCIGSDVESAAVFFVDYGNHESVPHSRLCQIPDSFLELPCIALHCILKGISVEGVKEKAYERLPELLPKNTPMSVKVVSHNEEDGTYVIDVPSVVNSLVSEGLVCRES